MKLELIRAWAYIREVMPGRGHDNGMKDFIAI